MYLCSFIDTGNFALVWFSEKNRDAVCALYCFETEQEKEDFKTLHQNMCLTLKCLSSTEKIDVEVLRDHNIETNLLALKVFPKMRW